MGYDHLKIERMQPHIGAEISGVDLGRDLAPVVVEELRRALAEFGVLGFRDQNLSVEQQVQFAAKFGELYIHPVADQTTAFYRLRKATPRPEVYPIYADEKSTRAVGEGWHSDASCDLEPPLGSILCLQEVPDVGGDTLFSSMYAAYDALTVPMKAFLQDLTAEHDAGHVYRAIGLSNKEYVSSEHPVICIHPESGRKMLFVNPLYTTRIFQLSKTESDAILAFLHRHCETPDFQCRFKWRSNSVLFWDNRCVHHKAIFDYWPQRRVGTRVQVRGSKPSSRLVNERKLSTSTDRDDARASVTT